MTFCLCTLTQAQNVHFWKPGRGYQGFDAFLAVSSGTNQLKLQKWGGCESEGGRNGGRINGSREEGFVLLKVVLQHAQSGGSPGLLLSLRLPLKALGALLLTGLLGMAMAPLQSVLSHHPAPPVPRLHVQVPDAASFRSFLHSEHFLHHVAGGRVLSGAQHLRAGNASALSHLVPLVPPQPVAGEDGEVVQLEAAPAHGSETFAPRPPLLPPVFFSTPPPAQPPDRKQIYCTQKASRETGPRLWLIDGMNHIYMSYFASLRDSPTERPPPDRVEQKSNKTDDGTLLHFADLLSGLVLQYGIEDSDLLAVVIDAKDGKASRQVQFKAYKAGRKPMPSLLSATLPRLTTMLEQLHIPVLRVPGVEADDVIGTLALRGMEAGYCVRILSNDKDFQQLLSERVTLLSTQRPKRTVRAPFNTASIKSPPVHPSSQLLVGRGVRPAMVEAHTGKPFVSMVRFEHMTQECYRYANQGLYPKSFVDVLALCGDESDNIPGVRGIRVRSARGLIKQHGSVEAVLSAARESVALQEHLKGTKKKEAKKKIKHEYQFEGVRGRLLRDNIVQEGDSLLLYKALLAIQTNCTIAGLAAADWVDKLRFRPHACESRTELGAAVEKLIAGGGQAALTAHALQPSLIKAGLLHSPDPPESEHLGGRKLQSDLHAHVQDTRDHHPLQQHIADDAKYKHDLNHSDGQHDDNDSHVVWKRDRTRQRT
eukprot:g79338.t1